jgi:lipopolysaccharide transport system permease protein
MRQDNIFKNWYMILALTLSDFKLRYSGSMLGFLWSFVKPLSMFAVTYIAFHYIFKVNVQNYVFFLFLGILLWNFFVESTTISMNNFITKARIIKNVYFPRTIIVISACLNAMLTLLVNLLIFMIFAIIFSLKASALNILIFLICLVMIFMISVGVSFILVAIYAKFRDMYHIWEVFIQLGFFATPIVYDISMIPEKYLPYYMLNPLSRILYYAKSALIYDRTTPGLDLAVLLAICLAVLYIGYRIYLRSSRGFAEVL